MQWLVPQGHHMTSDLNIWVCRRSMAFILGLTPIMEPARPHEHQAGSCKKRVVAHCIRVALAWIKIRVVLSNAYRFVILNNRQLEPDSTV